MSGLILRLGILFWGVAGMPADVMAAWPAQPHAAVQPVLITTLALTSLVLFLVYVLTRKHPRMNRSRDSKAADAPLSPLKIERALEHLFEHQKIPMAKLSLDDGRILDATPSLSRALGYPKAELLTKTGEELAIIQKDQIPELLATGWSDTESRLFSHNLGEYKKCHIVNIICRSTAPPCILSIVSGICSPAASEPLPGFISDLLDNRTIIQ